MGRPLGEICTDRFEEIMERLGKLRGAEENYTIGHCRFGYWFLDRFIHDMHAEANNNTNQLERVLCGSAIFARVLQQKRHTIVDAQRSGRYGLTLLTFLTYFIRHLILMFSPYPIIEVISSSALNDIGDEVTGLVPSWTARYQVHVKCRGVLAAKGFIVGAEQDWFASLATWRFWPERTHIFFGIHSCE